VSRSTIQDALSRVLAEWGVDDVTIGMERPRDPTHGDLSTNLALTLAARLGKAPRAIAEDLRERLSPLPDGVTGIEIAGPGFLNFRLAAGEITGILATILEADAGWGRSEEGDGRPVMVEFVSANPTGPLHLGHGRQAALGDAIAALLDWTGWKAHREYYYNDAGRQIGLLASSVRARYLQSHDVVTEVPEGGYQGEYVREIAQRIRDDVGDRYVEGSEEDALSAMQELAVRVLRAEQDRDLRDFGVHFDHHFLESSLYESGAVDQTIARLRETGLVYEEDGALWFRSDKYGDQKPRVMVKSDGSPTYFLPDVAYHISKWERGFEHVINVQGSDHHGTVARVRGGLRALGLPEGYPEYLLHQLVTVEKGGVEVKFSKRAGSYTTLRELFDEVGVDVARYFFQMRKPDSHLVFDLDVALDRSEKNPVYKVQYAHARMCSIFGKAGLAPGQIDGAPDLSLLTHPLELELAKTLGDFPAIVSTAATLRAPHLICDYLERTAGQVNSWYHAGNPSQDPTLAVLVDEPGLRKARLGLASAIRIVLRNGLTLLGLSAPERMTRDEES